jgi:predicted NAD/FAD-dependent oxidoreductase
MRRAGCYVDVFEQDRMIGGRLATTRVGGISFDHGAQYVMARGQAFGNYLDELVGGGYAAPWKPRTSAGENNVQMTPWIVGTPGMASIVRPLAEGLRIHTGMRAHTIARAEGKSAGWHIWFDDQTNAGPFSAIAIAVPAPQARLLLGRLDDLMQPLGRARMMPCWALMVHLDRQLLPTSQDVISDMSEVVRWVARNNHKPGRTKSGESIVVHASPGYSREAEDVEPEVIAEELWSEVKRAMGLPNITPQVISATLWRHGLVDQSLGESYVFSSQHMVGVAGDWCLGRLAEHAFESGHLLGRAIVSSL